MIIAPEAPLKKETSTEIICGHRPFVGWFYICVGIAILYAGFNRHFENRVDYVISGALIMFGIIILGGGMVGAMKRFEILINLPSRTYVNKKGYFPNISI
jgi:hypothetical protein